jgi:type VI protein secretion system component Hcp
MSEPIHDLDLRDEEADSVRGGINGESVDSDHKGEIELESWTWGVSPRAAARPQAARR